MHRASMLVATGLFVLLALSSSRATGGPAVEWPIERIVANLESRLKETPDDAQTHYGLGRAHAFAFSLKRSSLWAHGDYVADLADQDRKRKPSEPKGLSPRPPPPDEAALRAHLAEGVAHLRRACALAPQQGRFHLTLAWLLEIGAPQGEHLDASAVFELQASELSAERVETLRRWIEQLSSSDAAAASDARAALASPENLESAVSLLSSAAPATDAARRSAAADLVHRYWIERSIAEYWRAFEVTMSADLARSGLSIEVGKGLNSLVSYEALDAYRRLVQQRGARPEEEERLAKAAEQCKELEAKPRGAWITPLLLSLDSCRSLEELTAPNLTVPFDLDGDCVDELWPWLAPDAGWLVWDPRHRGEITTGQQLFGTASSWLFFEDGYRVLDALDDDRDGELRGPELAGIAVWFDRDSDGVSDRGEVVAVEALGIVALATRATERIGASLGNPGGVELADGRILPTYDWVLESRTGP